MNIEEIVKSIIAQMLPLFNKKVLLFISSGTVNVDAVIEVLSKFNLTNYDLVLSDKANEINKDRFIEKIKGNVIDDTNTMIKKLKDCDIVLIPVMTRNTLCKSALGIADNNITTGIARALMLNKEVIAVRDSFDPKNEINIAKGFSKNESYNLMILNYESTLENFGMKFINSDEFKINLEDKFNNFSSSYKKGIKKEVKDNKDYKKIYNKQVTNQSKNIFTSSVLTVKDINKLIQNNEINIKSNTIITPLAKDFIYNNKIKVNYYD